MRIEKGTTTGESLQTYQAEVTAELERILAFWLENTLDEAGGGFVGQIDSGGRVNQVAPKGAILNARILWSFSAAYRHTGKAAYATAAKRAYDYLVNHFFDKTHGGIYWSVDAQGNALSTRKQIYALAFALYGLSEYYSATQDAGALTLCRELFQWIEQYSFDKEQGGYLEAFSREGELLEDLRLSAKDRNDPKTMNTHLHILEAYASLYRSWPDQQLALQLEGLIRLFLDNIIDMNTGHMMLFFTRDWQSTADLVSYGHDIEASWLLHEAAEVLGNPELLHQVESVAAGMAAATLEGLQADGSLYHELKRTENHYDTHREWWVSAEAMVGFLNAFQLTNEAHYLAHSIQAWEFAKKYLLDKEHGEWYWGVYNDYSLMRTEDKVGFWKCPYHNSRACLEVMSRCENLLT
ncbi:AGE family epimerase/isomerase [Pontibacter sp. SGAir0037]|uniref:AGE family epimerase/isomerase n=1 Tax=Pontibacter sp. SGAir0037 TaxID=2571030 RepID=UPI0010CD6BDB|nr:AGE family epimerase/isomerase [Pontibacter sp. SGAir0037]QCR22128.1 N-acyl-D-glucosamine 2-epimerase [Pontibacter sp. SGAir0037]